VRPAEVASPLAAHKNPRKAQIHVGPLSNWNRQGRCPPIPGKRLADARSIQVRRMRYPKRSSVARTRPSPGFFFRSDRTVFFPDGRYTQYACRRAVRLSALRCGTRRSAEAATLQLLQFKGARIGHCFAIHYVGTKKGSKT
jgi:hypothetical protein